MTERLSSLSLAKWVFYYECMSYIHVHSSACWCNRGYSLSRFNGVYFLFWSISSVPWHMKINRIIDHIDKFKSNKHYDNHNIVCQMPMEFSWLPPLSFQNVVSPTRMNSKDRLHSWKLILHNSIGSWVVYSCDWKIIEPRLSQVGTSLWKHDLPTYTFQHPLVQSEGFVSNRRFIGIHNPWK